MRQLKEDVTLDILAETHQLSVRVYNICQANGLTSLNRIIEFCQNNGSFLMLNNCGKNSEAELIKLYELYQDQLTQEDVPLKELVKKHSLSIRSYNFCKSSGLTSLNRIIRFYQDYGSFFKIKNCGKKSERELIELCKEYIDPINIRNEDISTKTQQKL